MLQIKSFTFNPFMENTFLLFDETKEAVILDPGCYEKAEKETLKNFISKEGLNIKYLINTHCHIDHVLGNAYIKRQYNVPLLMHKNEVVVLKSVSSYASNYGFPAYEETEPDKFIDENDQIEFGNMTLKIKFVPGHAPGHLIFYNLDSNICIAGDTLFQGSIGRTDLPGGDHLTLLNAIKTEMFTLPETMTIYPGHGPETNIGFEKINNPFVGERAKF
ncbi:Zn-dependent hydrolase, glyoxylase [Belliella baltica DSM 15883]|uniref:Zn-dependent hydrolase, glyoxylase n=1 Tax=Belliella baltica (strain DSM 15883 / CIP 108006 / LMG 21964 / BA134) TaxID=866536 RepID=I3Z0M5_BELBD|nr:MBL fold metallo-hydrolase [Belliella baltica]AFL82793.1 Zn-dependent hydrolase, glyoxylase [Belliella baltica DSM 15883]